MKYLLFIHLFVIFSLTRVISQTNSKSIKSNVFILANDKMLFDFENGKYKLAFKYIDENGVDQRLTFKKGDNRLNIKKPVFIIQQDALETPFYICPNDSIQIFDNQYNGVVFKHKSNSSRTAELNFFSILLDSIKGFTFSTKGKPLETFDQIVTTELDIHRQKLFSIKFASRYFSKFQVSNQFKKDCLKQISNFAFNDTLSLVNEYHRFYEKEGLYEKRMAQILRSSLFNNIEVFNNSDIFSVEHFNNVFLFYKDYSYFKDTSQIKILVNYIQSTYFGDFKNLLLKRVEYLAKSLYVNLPLQNSIIGENAFLPKKFVLGSDKFLTTTLENVTTLKKIILSNSESFFFIDFWASWCKPCREEFKYSHKLELKYSKKIKFLYFSLDDDVNSWIRASKQEKIPSKSNFLMLETTSSELKNIFKIITIPRYIIIDRKMNIISFDSPRPSSNLLIEIFQRLILN